MRIKIFNWLINMGWFEEMARNHFVDKIKDVEYNSFGNGCGLEDQNITDRYEAMEYGWKCAIDNVVDKI